MDLVKSDLCTIKQLAARQPAFSEASLRYHVFMARSGKAQSVPGNGLETAIVRVGRKVLISEVAFLAWIHGGKRAEGSK